MRLTFLVCLIHLLPLLGYEHPIPFTGWYFYCRLVKERKPAWIFSVEKSREERMGLVLAALLCWLERRREIAERE